MDLKQLQNGSDIRGIALGEKANLTGEAVYRIAKAFAAWLAARLNKSSPTIAVGMDSRLSGPAFRQECIRAFSDSGANVVDCGLASTPAMFMTTVTDGFECDGAAMITASHLPVDRNGLKFFTKDGGLEKSDIAKILSIAEGGAFITGCGSIAEKDFISVYAKILMDKVRTATGEERPLAGLKIIVDAGNGAGGFYVDKVLKPLGADTRGSQFLNPDGSFPNHVPNPEDETAMRSIMDAVKKWNADFGIIFDTDVDRAAAVDKGGVEMGRNRLIAAISAILIAEHQGATIVTDSITSSGLAEFIAAKGGRHHRFKRGYKNVINEAVRLNSEGIYTPLAIETSGHAALMENYFLDDGAYLVTRLVIQLARLRKENRALASMITDLKEPAESSELRPRILAEDFRAYGNKVVGDLTAFAKKDPKYKIAPDNFEGIRVAFGKEDGDGWFLLRLSLHEPLLPINIESDSAGGARKIAQRLYDFLLQYKELDLKPLASFLKEA
jgi:phosphomannomutase